ncbi:MAG: DUF1156 domain-containing protein [Thermoguttaceae bacterium]
MRGPRETQPAKAGTPAVYTPHDIKHMLASPEAVNHFLATYGPPVLDPFCGGGSIPLEAQRLGLRAYGSDLNPVAVLITKALIEIPPTFAGMPPVNPEWQKKLREAKAARVWQGAQGLAEDVRYYGKWMRDEAEKRIGHLYPKVKITKEMARDRPELKEFVGQALTVIAWLWARTVSSPNPTCKRAHVPLVRSFFLSTKKDKQAWVRPIIDAKNSEYAFVAGTGTPPTGFDPKKATINRSGATCLLTGTPIPFDHIRTEGQAGRLKSRLMAIVAEGPRGRVYLSPTKEDETVAQDARPRDVPETELPEDALGFRVQNYGMTKHHQLFTDRQLVAMTTFCNLVGEARKKVLQEPHSSEPYSNAVTTYLGLLVSKCADYWSNLCVWRSDPKNLGVGHVFARQAVSMIWDFAEANPFSASSGSWESSQRWTELVLKECVATQNAAASQVSATNLSCSSPSLISTDPPYYDNVPYADLSDMFYIWLRRALQPVHPDLLGTVLVPKVEELVADPFRRGGKEEARAFFEHGIGCVFRRMREKADSRFPTTIYYAFKQTEEEDGADTITEDSSRASTGWETFLQGLIDAGWQINGTWPTRTELGNRTRSMGSNALASSIVLVCRPRPQDAPLATRKEYVGALRHELPVALRDLQSGSVAPVDLAQASIGPGMAVFTRYSKVMETDGSPMTVRTALGLINQALDEVLAEQEGEFDTDTRWALAWFEQFGMDEGAFGTAETLSRAKNTAANGLVEAGIVRARGGKVQLIKREELDADWDPATDKRLTVWEIAQHLIRTQQQAGEVAAAALMHKLGGMAETARDLAYRLYSILRTEEMARRGPAV